MKSASAVDVILNETETGIVTVYCGADLAKIGMLVALQEIADFLIAAAIVMPGKLAQLRGNLYRQMQSRSYPQRQFADADKALHWVRRQVAQDEANQ